MATTPPAQPTPVTVPDRADRTNFPTQMSAAWTYLFGTLSDWWADAGDATYDNAVLAEASANTATLTSGAVMFNAGTSYTQGQAAISATNFQTYRRKTAGTSATDPAADSANWEGVLIKTIDGVSLVGSGNVALPIGMKLLATVTPTVAASVDFLTLFSADYDNYLVVMEGIKPATGTRELNLRFAVAGVADAGSNYTGAATINAATTTASTLAILSADVHFTPTGGLSGEVMLTNCNDAVRAKGIGISTCSQSATTPGWTSHIHHRLWFAANAASGFRLYFTSNDFAAGGKIRVYGLINT